MRARGDSAVVIVDGGNAFGAAYVTTNFPMRIREESAQIVT